MKKFVSLFLLFAMLISVLSACTANEPADQQTTEPQPMEVPQADNVAGKPTDQTFETVYMRVAVELLQKSAGEKQGDNVLISPLSVQLALAMTANGAKGKTLQEMQTVLGQDIPLEDLNLYLYGYLYDFKTGIAHQEDCKLQIGNSVWLRDKNGNLQVEEDFLQNISNYYDAEIFKRPFDNATLDEINAWAAQKTDGMIPKVLEKINKDSMMYLINAITFDAKWADPYNEYAVHDGDFTTQAGKKQNVSMLHSEEGLYLEDNRATGFIKPYEGGRFGFAVLLPNEGTDVYDYMNGLTAESLAQTLSEAKDCTVFAQMPKFSYDFELSMNEILKQMGMPTAFDQNQADLSGIGTSKSGNLYIGNVLHKTFIRVDGMGTQAGAITMVEVPCGAAMNPEREVEEVIVDRPFVYMILDMEKNMPLFIGCVTEVTE